MSFHSRLKRVESAARQQQPQQGDCYPHTKVLVLTGNLDFDRQMNNIGHTRFYLDREWREQALLTLVEALADGKWHQGHHTDSWQGERGKRELWPLLREQMTWLEKCDLLQWLEDAGLVERRCIESGAGIDIFGEYRLREEIQCEAQNSA